MSPATKKDDLGAIPPPRAASDGFAALVGQDAIVAALRSAIGRGRLPHALLFGGPPGVGKATCAGILAQALNCTELGPLEACGRCISCDKIARGIHPDVLWSAPSPRFIDIGTIRQLSNAVGYAPHEGRRRVVVIDDAQAMKPAAQNAFLKTLEEPPASSLIILVTPTPGSLLATVRSRCQSLRFSPVPLPRVREYLERHQQMEAGEARLRASLAPGSIGAAIAVDLDAYAELLETVVDGLRLAAAGGGGIVAAADELAGAGHGELATQRAASTLFVARDVLRDLLVVTSGGDLNTLVNIDRVDAWRAWAAEVEANGVAEALGAVNAGIERLTTGIQPNIKMALERTLIDVFRALEVGRPGQAAGTRR